MGFFDDGFFGGGFDEIFNHLANEGYVEYSSTDSNGKKRTYRRGKKAGFGKVFLEKVITSDKTYLVFDFSGMKDISVNVVDELMENSRGKEVPTGEKVLEVYEGNKTILNFPLENIKSKHFESSFNNGILEVTFRK